MKNERKHLLQAEALLKCGMGPAPLPYDGPVPKKILNRARKAIVQKNSAKTRIPDKAPGSSRRQGRNRRARDAQNAKVTAKTHKPLLSPADGWNFSRVQRLARKILGPTARVVTRELVDPEKGPFATHFVGIQTPRGIALVGSGVTWWDLVERTFVKPAAEQHKAETPAA